MTEDRQAEFDKSRLEENPPAADASRPREKGDGPGRVRRIGLVAVHGIGDQGRFHFLDGLVRDLGAAFAVASSGGRVSVSVHAAGASLMGAAAPTLAEGPGPSAEIVVREADGEGERVTRIGVHEVWWGDIVDPPTLFQPLRFFAWGLAMWAVPLKRRKTFREEKRGTVGQFLAEPKPPEGRGWRTQFQVRARLFFAGYLVVAIGVALSLILALLRFLTRQNIPDPVMTAVSYMSDIKLYTQPTSPETVPLDHLGQHARFAIRARVLRTVTDAALAGYERWWVVAHSLGSVIAFSGLMTPDGLIARYLDEPRWRRLRREYEQAGAVRRDGSKVPVDTNVPCPAWMEPDWCVSRATLLERFAGLVTFGCPLDKFAMLWPAVIPVSRDQSGLADRPWLNVYDETDPVAGSLASFNDVDGRKADFRPRNLGYAAHPVPLYSHLRYLTVPRRGRADPAESLGVSLAKWWLGAAWTDGPAPTFDPGASARWWLPDHPSPGGGGRQRARWAWAFWVAIAIASPALTADALIWLRGSEMLDRVLPSWLGWPGWLPEGFLGLTAVLVAFAITLVFVAGLLGHLFSFSLRDVDPNTSAPPLGDLLPTQEPTTSPKPAVKDTAPYG